MHGPRSDLHLNLWLQHHILPGQGALLAERDFGVLLAVVTLLLGVVARNYEGYEGLVPKLVRLLERLRNKDVTPDYAYYGIPSPWLQVRTVLTLVSSSQPCLSVLCLLRPLRPAARTLVCPPPGCRCAGSWCLCACWGGGLAWASPS